MNMLLDLLQMYGKKGNFILDPMAGIGSIFVAMILGMNVYAIELEERFVKIAQRNLENIQSNFDVKGATGLIIQGDARKILPLSVPVDFILFSPPYGDIQRKSNESEQKFIEYYGSTTAQGYGENQNQIGNLPYQMQKWEMNKIYNKCYEQLKPGSFMIVITKDYIKAKKKVEVGVGTIKSCIDAGFTLYAHHLRECWLTGMQAVHMKEPDYKPVLYEDIFVFKR